MFEIVLLLAIVIGLVLTIAMCWQESKRRNINFFLAIFFCIILSPLITYFVISSFGLKSARGCKWCGNSENEAKFCGICRKNENGDLRPF